MNRIARPWLLVLALVGGVAAPKLRLAAGGDFHVRNEP